MISRCILGRCKNVYLKGCVDSTTARTLCNSVKPLTKESSEIEIKVPWGKVAAKLWGPKNEQPLLAIHGWQDNAGTFDKLVPFLSKSTSVLAIDLPGHGLSSWLPPGSMYNEIVYVLLIQRLRRYFGWDKVKILAHSMGAQMSFWYTTLFPEETQFVIALDALKLPSIDVMYYNKAFANAVQTLFKIESMNTPPHRYTEEQIMERWKANAVTTLDDVVCRTLMARGTTQMEDGKYIWNRDPRLKVLPIQSAFTHDHLQKAAELISCPYLVIKAEDSPYFESEKNWYDILDIMKKGNKHVYHERIPGGHHVHITDPQGVANIVNPFLEKYNSSKTKWENFSILTANYTPTA